MVRPREGDLPGRGARQALDRTGQPQQLLDRAGHQERVREQPGALVRVVGERYGRPAEETCSSVVPPGDQHEAEPEDLVEVERAVVDPGRGQVGEHVRTRVPASVGDEVGEVGVEVRDRPGSAAHDAAAGVGLHDRAAPGVELRPVLLGHAQVGRDHDGREPSGEQIDEVSLTGVGEQRDPFLHEAPERRLEGGDPSGREAAADQAPEDGVLRPVHHHQGRFEPERDDLVALIGEPLGRGEEGRVVGGREHILEARQHPEPERARDGPDPRPAISGRAGTAPGAWTDPGGRRRAVRRWTSSRGSSDGRPPDGTRRGPTGWPRPS